MLVVKRRAREALPYAFNIGVFKFLKYFPIQINHIHKKSENLIGSCFWQQWLLESPINDVSDWHGEYGGTSLHTRLLDAEHM